MQLRTAFDIYSDLQVQRLRGKWTEVKSKQKKT